MKLNYLPISPQIAAEARETLRDRFGHELSITKETAPCRVCLRIPEAPEELMLCSYQPLADRGRLLPLRGRRNEPGSQKSMRGTNRTPALISGS